MPSSPRVCSPLRKEFKRAFEDTDPPSALTPPPSTSSPGPQLEFVFQGGENRVRRRPNRSSNLTPLLRKREFRTLEDVELIKDFAVWLTGAGDRYISEKNFDHDLADGVALCTVMSKIQGSGVASFHKVAPVGGHKARENFITFQIAVQRLHLPSTFGLDDLNNRNYSDVFTTLLFLAHVCHCQDVANEAMTDAILEKLEEIDEALEESFGPMEIEASAQTIEESLADMQRSMSANAAAMMKLMSEATADTRAMPEDKEDPWFQAVAKYMMTLKDLRAKYGAVRADQIVDRTVTMKNSLPCGVRSTFETLTGSIAARMEQLPESIKSKLPLETIKRFG